MKKVKNPIAFDFVIENLHRANPVVKQMFGCHTIYIGNKIVAALRKKEEHTEDNGVWMATTPEHHASLKKDFPSMRSITVFGTGVSSWQILPEEADDFEQSVTKLCDLIIKGDKRIGKIPKAKKLKTK